MRYTFLGTGTSQGIPVMGCQCEVCTSNHVKDKRLRTALLVESSTTKVCIDIGPDFRYQMLRENINHLDAIVITHEHNDHVAGLDEVRALNFIQQKPMKLYCTERVQAALRKMFFYIFENSDYPGVPQIEFVTINKKSFQIGDILFQPIHLMHADMPVLGFRMGNFTYITDANYISEEDKDIARNSEVLVLDALRKGHHHSHFTLEEAVELSKELKASQTYFTHISHQMGRHKNVNLDLPHGMELAWDELEVELE